MSRFNLYDSRRLGAAALLAVSIGLVAVFLYVSGNLVNDLAQQERERMQIWADATKQISDITLSDTPADSNLDFLFSIIERNRTIPVLLTDNEGNILDHRNFDLPDPDGASAGMMQLSETNRKYLLGKIAGLQARNNVIHIIITPDNLQHLYYDDSKLLKRLSYYPYVQIIVMIAFIMVVYYAVSSTKRAEQNKVWVGLSKETAHQLGTPISSLMAWMQLLGETGVDADTVAEMNKDVERLSTIASRFSKIGSRPQMETVNLNDILEHACGYMGTRISSRIALRVELCKNALKVKSSAPLIEWVVENLMKNAVDAMEGKGSITVESHADNNKAVVTVTDTGKGISRKNQKAVFKPGFTTKKRGWGLGLTLAKRIIEQYHGGHIWVSRSEPGTGTTFTITLPLCH